MADETFPPAIVRELLDGDLAPDNRYLDQHTGRVDSELGKVLSFRQAAWETRADTDGPYQETRKWKEAVRTSETARTTRAIETGNQSQLSFETGIVERELSAEFVQALAMTYGLIRHPGRILNFCGGTDHGKTNVVWVAISVFVELESDPWILGNTRRGDLTLPDSWEYAEIGSIEELEELMESQPDREKIVFVDDASIDHSAHASSSKEVEKRQGRLARLAAKLHARLIYVGHRDDGKDLAKHVRAMPGVRHVRCNRIEEEDGTIDRYVANVYNDLDDDTGHLSDLVATLDPLPEANVEYDPDAVAHNLFS